METVKNSCFKLQLEPISVFTESTGLSLIQFGVRSCLEVTKIK